MNSNYRNPPRQYNTSAPQQNGQQYYNQNKQSFNNNNNHQYKQNGNLNHPSMNNSNGQRKSNQKSKGKYRNSNGSYQNPSFDAENGNTNSQQRSTHNYNENIQSPKSRTDYLKMYSRKKLLKSYESKNVYISKVDNVQNTDQKGKIVRLINNRKLDSNLKEYVPDIYTCKYYKKSYSISKKERDKFVKSEYKRGDINSFPELPIV